MPSRGHDLESAVNRCNIDYRKSQVALIEKKPTPIEITKLGAVMKQSTVDYTGILAPMGRGVAFDAKETKSKTSFPLANVKQHQLIFLEYWQAMGGLAFFLIHFTSLEDMAFMVPFDFVNDYYVKGYIECTGRKSIPYKDFDQEWLVPLDNYLWKIIEDA